MSFCKLRRATGASSSRRASVVFLAMSVLAGGCAATTSGPSRVAGPVSGYPGEPDQRASVSRAAPVEMEADGLPAQVAPKRRRPVLDDPREPWSPNYGTVRPDNRAALPAPRQTPANEPAIRVATQSAGPRLDPDDIIRLAIAEHEMRRN